MTKALFPGMEVDTPHVTMRNRKVTTYMTSIMKSSTFQRSLK